MAATDNKLLDGAGVAKLSQLIKEEIAQGGGSSYTAGAGIDIDSNNVISHTTPFPPFLSVFLGLVSGTTYNAENNRSMIVPHESDYTKEQWKDVFLNTGEAFVYIDSAYAGPLAQAIAEFENITTTSQTINIINSSTSLMDSQYTYTFSSTTAKPLNYWLNTNYVYYIAYNPSGFGLSSVKPHWVVIRDPFKQMASGYFQSTQGITATSIGGALDELATNIPSIATVATAGIVKPDGTTITVDANGVISSQGGSSLPTDPNTDGAYKLVNTVETEGGVQTATITWEEDAQYSFEEILQDFLNYTTIDEKTYQSIPNGEAVLGIYRSDNDEQAWTGVQSGKWFLWGWGSLTKTTITQLSNDYGITQWRLIGLSGGSSSSGPISGPYWKPQDVSGATCLCKRNDTAQKLDCVPVTNLNASLASLIITYMDVYDGNNNHARIRDWLSKIPSIATTQTAGIVKPDGTTITIDSNGVISSQGGGSSLPTDPSTDGVYKLINTVETEGGVQTATQSWEEDTGGGGATYTGGLGIAIDSNNVINNETFDVAGLFQILTGLGRSTGESVFRQISRNSKNYLIESLKEQRPCYILGSGNSLSTTELYNLGFRAGVSYNRLTGERVQWGTYEVSGSSGPVPSQYSAVIPMGSFLFIATGASTDFPIYGKLNLIPDMLYYNNTTSGLTSSTIKGAIDEVAASIATRIPPCPTTADGNYVLKCTVSSGTPTYSWVAEA